jgi:DNA invertase Pin-like site-specific DNA recombinase
MTKTVGYARVSTFEQIMDLQRDALAAAGCDRVFTDTMSGSRSKPSRMSQGHPQRR